MARRSAGKILDCRKRTQGLRLTQLRAFDRAAPGFRTRLEREALLVRGHDSTREANDFLAELWEERLEAAENSSS